MGVATDLTSKQLGLLGVGAGVVAAGALVVLGLKTAEMAGNFQVGVNRLRTGAGDVQDSFNTLSNGIKRVAIDTGTATGLLIPAMYQILSSGQRGAQAFSTLAAAAKGAKIEQASVADVANVLSGLMTNYGTKVFGATQYMNGLIKAVSSGKVTLQDLAVAMGPIDPIAQHLGISMADVAAAMTTQTNAMIPAHIAATGLRFLMQQLENPTKKATTAMQEMGLNTVTVANEMKVSLPGTLEMIYNAAKRAGPEGSVPFNRAIADMVGGIRSTTAFMALTGPHFAAFVKNSAAISDAMRSGKGDVTGWALVQGNFNLQMDRAKAAMEVLGITIGQALLPALTKIVTAITPVIVAVTDWLVKNNMILPILGILAAVIGGILVASLISLVAASWPVIAVIAGIIAAVAGIIFVVQHWGQIMQWMGNLMGTIGAWIGNVMSTIGTFFHTVLGDIGSFVGGVFSAIGTTIRNALTGALNIVTTVWNAIKSAFGTALGFIGDLVGKVFSSIGTWFTWLYDHNYYIKALVDFIVKAFTDLKNFVGVVFSAIGTFIHDRLVWIQNTTGAIFSAIGTFIRDRLTWIYNTVGAIFSAIGTFIHGVLSALASFIGGIFSAIGSLMSGKANDAKNAVGDAFSRLGTLVQGILGGFLGFLGGFFGNLAGQAFQWGANFIGGLINGIKNMVGNLFSQVGSIAQGITHVLGFHSPPPEGPMRDADQWMPNMMSMFVSGVQTKAPDLRRALSGALTPVGTTLSVGATGVGNYLPGGVSVIPAGGFPSSRIPGSYGAGSGNAQPIYLQINGYTLARLLMPSIVANIRNNVGVTNL